jgi:hypothetical protein
MTDGKEPWDDDRRVDEAIAESFRRATRPPGRWDRKLGRLAGLNVHDRAFP